MTAAAIIIAAALLVLSLRRKDGVAASLLAAVLITLTVNACMAGALSDVHDRYQSRVAWLAPWAVALIYLRWKKHGDRKSVS